MILAPQLWPSQIICAIRMCDIYTLKNYILSVLKACLIGVLLSVYAATADTISGRFELVDHRGNLVTQSSYNDQLRLVFFGFTRCPIICPTTMSEISKVMSLLEHRANQVKPIFISIDPEHDTVQTVADYISVFHPSVVGLTGTAEQVKQAAEGFNVTYGRGPVNSLDEAEEIFHTSYLYLMDREGKLLDVIGYGTRPAVILEKLEQHL